MKRAAEIWEVSTEAAEAARRRIQFLLSGWSLAIHKSNLEGMLTNAYLQGAVDAAGVLAKEKP